jgi:N-methylhydantoinase A
MHHIVAVDTGGTFTDCVVLDSEGGFTRAKSSSTPRDFSTGVVQAVEKAARQRGLSLTELLKSTAIFSHGTTVATNAFITGRFAKTGFVTTRGAEDTLLIGRGAFQKTGGLTEVEIGDSARIDKPPPLASRLLTRGISERMDRHGEVVVPLDENQARQAIQELLDTGAEAFAVCLLWSFKNPAHEQRIKNLLLEMAPEAEISLSSELVPVLGEYQRATTTTINASLNRITSAYLGALESKLQSSGLATHPLIMQSAGGVVTFERARKESVSLLSSGPTGGLMACLLSGGEKGYRDILCTDVGGTSFDVGIIIGGKPQYAREPIVGRYHLRIPMLQVESIGAGGGSIAYVETGTKHLKVGPVSAGADPGPACYDRGGDDPTVTDADLVLNRLNPNYFLGGSMTLKPEKSRDAIRKKIADPLGISVEEAAISVIRIIDARMADLIRRLTIGRGYDPKNFVVFAFGGAGPAHAAAYTKDIGAKTVIIPSTASVFSARGIATCDFLRIKEISSPTVLTGDCTPEICRLFDSLERDAVSELASESIETDRMFLERTMDVRYRGQLHEIRVPMQNGTLTPEALDKVRRNFESIYEQTYGLGTAFPGAEIEAVIFRLSAMGITKKPASARFSTKGRDPRAAFKEKRPVYWQESGGFQLTDVYEIERLEPGQFLRGPAIIEGVDTTVVVHPGESLEIDEFRDLVLTV